MSTYKILLIVHVILGFSALISGLIAMLFKKKKGNHSISGWFYYYSMLGVFLTVIPLFIIKGTPILFLLLIGIFSEYQVLTGVRYLQIKNRLKNIRWYDYLVVGIGSTTGIIMVGLGVYYFMVGQAMGGMLLTVFGIVMLINGFQDARFLFKLSQKMKVKRSALTMHIGRMGGAYIATFTAFFVNNYGGLLPYNMSWFLPGIIGGIIISRTIRKYSVKPQKATL